jgi:hypothetical protein
MSKRYGRNQKRKHKKKIQHLEETLITEREVSVSTLKKYKYIKNELNNLTHALIERFPNSVFLEPKICNKASKYPSEYKLPISIQGPVNGGPSPTIECTNIDLYALDTFMRENEDKIKQEVHLRLSSGEGSVYYISKEALSNMPTDLIASRIAPDIANKLVSVVQSQLRR